MADNVENAINGTPQAGETEVAHGTDALNKDVTMQVETGPKEELVSKVELDKALMRKNQLEKQLETLANSTDLSEKEAEIAKLRAELQATKAEEAAKAQSEALDAERKAREEVFENSLKGYPEAVQELARFNKEKFGIDSIVGDAQYSFQAEKSVKDYLDGLSGKVKVEDKPEIKVNASNFAPQTPVNDLDIAKSPNELAESEHDFLSKMAKDGFKNLYQGE